jgi:hypothetical protein
MEQMKRTESSSLLSGIERMAYEVRDTRKKEERERKERRRERK